MVGPMVSPEHPAERTNETLRHDLAYEMARLFLRHLREELTKPGKVVDYTTLEGIPFRTFTENMIADLLREFPTLAGAPAASVNFFEQYWNRRGDQSIGALDHSASYAQATFKTMNRMFYTQIQNVRRNDGRLYQEWFDYLRTTAQTMNSRGRKFDFRSVFSSNTFFHTSLEDALRTTDLPFEEARRILFDQFTIINRVSHEVLDGILQESLARTEEILGAIFPEHVVAELRQGRAAKPRRIEQSAVMFCDLAGFTTLSGALPPEQLLAELDDVFSHLDRIVHRHRMEKIKTIGDCYMCATALPFLGDFEAVDAALCALQIQKLMQAHRARARRKGRPEWRLRIGIHTGPVVAGVIGQKRFHYDIWGDTVNLAQRMEANGEVDRVNVSGRFARRLHDWFLLESRGPVNVKGIGPMEMLFVTGLMPEASVGSRAGVLRPELRFGVKDAPQP